jgi:hypothetical protein
MSAKNATGPWRRLTQWSMRGLLILIALAAIFFAWLRTEMVKESRRRELTGEGSAGHWVEYYVDSGPIQFAKATGDSMLKESWVRYLAAVVSGNDPVGPLVTIEFKEGFDPVKAAEVVKLFPEATTIRIACQKLDAELATALGRRPRRGGESISTTVLADGDADQIVRACAENQLPLTELRTEKPLSRAGLADAAKIASLNHLVMDNVDDAIIALFRDHRSLERLEIRNSPQVSDASGEVLASCRGLAFVTLDGTSLKDEGLAALRNGSVTRLIWKNAPLPLAGLRALRDRPGDYHLLGIGLGSAEVTDEHLKVLAEFPHLGDVRLINANITRAGLEAIAKRTLYQLILRDCHTNGEPIDDQTIEPLAAIASSLGDLRIDGANVTDAGLAPLVIGPNLMHLSLCRTKVTTNTVDLLSKSTTLIRLRVGGENFDASWMPHIGKIPTLTWLQVRGPSVDDAMFSTSLPTIRLIDLQETRVTPECLGELAKWPALEHAIIMYDKAAEPEFSLEDMRNYIRHTGAAITVGEISKPPSMGVARKLNVEVMESRDELE